MRAFARRRYRGILSTTLGAALVFLAETRAPTLGSQHLFTGWLLAAGLLLLVLFNARKKIPMLPLLTAAFWLQMHIYVGLLAAFVFAVHTGLRYPRGVFNQALWWCFVALTASGIFGIWAARAFAPRLRERGEAILFDRLGVYRLRLAHESELLAARSAADIGSPLVAECYRDRVVPFMAGSRNFWAHLRGTRRPIERLLGELRALERYLNPRGRETLHELQERVVAKDNLDYQHALMSVLRGWLFLHIPLAYGIFIMIGIHVVLVYAFGGLQR